jgi:hypothetical protein
MSLSAPATVKKISTKFSSTTRSCKKLALPLLVSKTNLGGLRRACACTSRNQARDWLNFHRTTSVVCLDSEPTLQANDARVLQVMYISGAFLLGTALCGTAAYGTWIYTKWKMNVKDGKEYAEKMRALTPAMKDNVSESFVGKSVRLIENNFRIHTRHISSAVHEFLKQCLHELHAAHFVKNIAIHAQHHVIYAMRMTRLEAASCHACTHVSLFQS